MTREEARDIVHDVVACYPNFKPLNLSETVDAWHMMLEEYSKNDIIVALKAYVTTDKSGFAPSVGQIVDKLHTLSKAQELSETEAWALVSKAIRNSSYNSVEEFAKLPPLVQKAVGIPEQLREWAIDENYNEMVVSSNFMRSYKTVLSRKEENAKLPPNIRMLVKNINAGSYESQIEQKRAEKIGIMQERKQSEKKALEVKQEGIPMPEEYWEMLK